jgi:hypothetical protein
MSGNEAELTVSIKKRMKNEKWKETKKEYTFSERGELIPKGITYELSTNKKWEKKDIWDMVFRTIAALSIGVPFIIFLVQRNVGGPKVRQLEIREIL